MEPKTLKLSRLERNFINNFQGNFPLEERPFICIAEQMACSEDKLIKTVKNMKDRGLLTRFGPLYDAAQLGGGLTLAAISVPENEYKAVTNIVNEFPEVAHNYRREHHLNMWFVLATETPDKIANTIKSIESLTKLKVYNFPKLHEFYIGLWLELFADGSITTIPVRNQPLSNKNQNKVSDYKLDQMDRTLIKATQTGLNIEATPYETIANSLACSQMEVIDRLKNMLANQIIRRIGAVPNHYRLGLTANGMTVWQVEEEDVIALGNLVGQLDFVSHCYQRPKHLPIWPYNLFAMVHGHTRESVAVKTKDIAELLGHRCKSHTTLFSSEILKKTGLRLVA